MARYIDADALIEKIQKLTVATDDMYGMGICRGIERVETAINMFPTVDVVPRVEIERLLDDFQRTMRADAKVGMSAGEILLHIGNMLSELKKKYTEK